MLPRAEREVFAEFVGKAAEKHSKTIAEFVGKSLKQFNESTILPFCAVRIHSLLATRFFTLLIHLFFTLFTLFATLVATLCSRSFAMLPPDAEVFCNRKTQAAP